MNFFRRKNDDAPDPNHPNRDQNPAPDVIPAGTKQKNWLNRLKNLKFDDPSPSSNTPRAPPSASQPPSQNPPISIPASEPIPAPLPPPPPPPPAPEPAVDPVPPMHPVAPADPAAEAKAARRRARRAAFDARREDELREFRNQEVIAGYSLGPPPLADPFTSASEDEAEAPSAPSSQPVHPQPSTSHSSLSQPASPPPPSAPSHTEANPFPQPDVRAEASFHAVGHVPVPTGASAPPSEYDGSDPDPVAFAPSVVPDAQGMSSVPPPQPSTALPTLESQHATTPNPNEKPPSNTGPNAAAMAEMFGAKAFGSKFVPTPPPGSPPLSSVPPPVHAAAPMHAATPAPVGWQSVFNSGVRPPTGLFGPPPTAAAPQPITTASQSAFTTSPLDINEGLSDRIRRGRELGVLAVEQEERGNIGAAEAGYMKALELLIPASRELDVGSPLTKNARAQRKKKLQREAAAMLDRCEELRRFLKANGPAPPKELPEFPDVPSETPRSLSDSMEISKGTDEGSAGDGGTSRGNGGISNPPPPPLPPAWLDDDDALFDRMQNRRNVVTQPKPSAADGPDAQNLGSPPHRPPPPPPPGPDLGEIPAPSGAATAPSDTVVPSGVEDANAAEKCVVCTEPSNLLAPCGHSFCSNCGNRVVPVFGRCPEPSCGTRISMEDFEHILR